MRSRINYAYNRLQEYLQSKTTWAATHAGVLHLHEGRSAFATLEMLRQRMTNEALTFEHASREVARQSALATHTPGPAGHDRFSAELIDEHLGPLRDALGISMDELMGLGRVEAHNPRESFCMTVWALKRSRRANAVSSLHGRVSRNMWTALWPERTEDNVPIGHVTNGIHVLSWLAPQMHRLYDRHLAPNWHRRSGQPDVWQQVEKVDDGELWEMHLTLKARLLDFVRRRAEWDAERRTPGSA